MVRAAPSLASVKNQKNAIIQNITEELTESNDVKNMTPKKSRDTNFYYLSFFITYFFSRLTFSVPF